MWAALLYREVEYLDGFCRYTRPDDCTLHCPCGSTYTWSGFDEGLTPWMKQHKPHQSLREQARAARAHAVQGGLPAPEQSRNEASDGGEKDA